MMRQTNAAAEAAQRYWAEHPERPPVVVIVPEEGRALLATDGGEVPRVEVLWQQEPCVRPAMTVSQMAGMNWPLRRYLCSGRHALRNAPLPGTPYADCAAAMDAFDRGTGAQLLQLARQGARRCGDAAAALLTGALAGFYPAEHAVRQAFCFAPLAPGGMVRCMPEVSAAARTVGCRVQLQMVEMDEYFRPVKAVLPLADADTLRSELPRESAELLALPGGRVELLVDGRLNALTLPEDLPPEGVVCTVRLEAEEGDLTARLTWPGMAAPVVCALTAT